MVQRICIAGATGWAGSALAAAVAAADDMQLVGAVARSTAGRKLGEVLGIENADVIISDCAATALENPCDIFVEFTKPDVARANILQAVEKGSAVVVGTSGLTDADYAEIGAAALENETGVLAVGNFALTVVLLQKFARMAARHIAHWEVIDYAGHLKPDAPSGTARELAHTLSTVGPSEIGVPLDQISGPKESRGATLGGTQVHSVRLPGYVISAEVLFGLPDERLTLRHDAGGSAQPYVGGAMLAIRKAGSFKGLKRGLDSVMDF